MNELTKHRQTALHLAAQQDLPTICSVLLENGVDFAAVDENGNNGNSVISLCSVLNASSSLSILRVEAHCTLVSASPQSDWLSQE